MSDDAPTREASPAHVDVAMTCEQARGDNLTFVLDALSARDVTCFLVTRQRGLRPCVGVLASQRDQALHALSDAAGSQPWRARWAAHPGERPPAAVALAGLGDDPGRRVLRVYQEFRYTGSPFRIGAQQGCEIEIWAAGSSDDLTPWQRQVLELSTPSHQPGAVVAPRPNGIAAVVPPAWCQPVTVEVDGSPYPTLRGLAAAPFDRVELPVDVVYTWVDGNDPQWQARRAEWLGRVPGPLPPDAAVAARYDDHDELRYSLRSLEQFLPWVRHVYLVTADQRPEWLRPDHPRLTVVSHRDILDPDVLPTFSSSAIETGLHRIDGLSEHYLYLNDDMLIGRPLDPTAFFHANGITRFFPASTAFLGTAPANGQDASWLAANRNARDLLADDLGAVPVRGFVHAPYATRRSVVAEVVERYADRVAATAASRFRATTDVAVATGLQLYYGALTGRALIDSIAAGYVDLSAADLAQRLKALQHRRPDVYCLNDTGRTPTTPQTGALVRSFLDRQLPVPSSFER